MIVDVHYDNGDDVPWEITTPGPPKNVLFGTVFDFESPLVHPKKWHLNEQEKDEIVVCRQYCFAYHLRYCYSFEKNLKQHFQ